MNINQIEEMELRNRELLTNLDFKLLTFCNNIVDIFIRTPDTKKQLSFGIKNLKINKEI